MARDKTIKFLRTTKANLESQKTGSNLLVGEPYLITDEGRIAVGTANNNYSDMAKKSEADAKKTDNVSATSRVLGRKTSGSGAIEELTLSEVLEFIGSAAKGDILYRDTSAWARLGKGSDGQVLTLASDIPSWATPSGGGFDPTTTVEIMEDFIGGRTATGQFGELGWRFDADATTINNEEGTDSNIGIALLGSGTSANVGRLMYLCTTLGTTGNIKGNQGNVTVILRAKNDAVSTNRVTRFGLHGGIKASADPDNGIFFRASSNGNWFAVTRKATTETATDTGVTQATSFKTFKIVTNSDGTSITFYIDGVSKATHTTNIPTASVMPSIQIVTNDTTERYVAVDYYYLKVTGLTR